MESTDVYDQFAWLIPDGYKPHIKNPKTACELTIISSFIVYLEKYEAHRISKQIIMRRLSIGNKSLLYVVGHTCQVLLYQEF